MADWGVVAARFFTFSSVLTLFGSSLFYIYGFRRMAPNALYQHRMWPQVTLLYSSVVALLGTTAWLMAETVVMTGEPKDAFRFQVLWSVLSETTFGNITSLRLILLAPCVIALIALNPSKRVWSFQALCAGGVLISFVFTGHGIMDDGLPGLVHSVSDVLHLLAAGIWTGALVPLAILVVISHSKRQLVDVEVAYHGLDGFSGIGLFAVSVLTLTGTVNSWFVIGPAHWNDLVTTSYGLVLLTKIGFFLGMLALAALNRFVLTPRLNHSIQRDKPLAETIILLRNSVFLETSLATLVLVAVSILGTLEPPIATGSSGSVTIGLQRSFEELSYAKQLVYR